MDLGLQGKKALVTAASSGLGLATAIELVKEGADVFICGRSTERLAAALELLEGQAAAGVTVLGRSTDVSDPAEVAALVNEAATSLDGLDILVTNAGGPPGGTIASTDIASWEKGIDITLMSAVHLVKQALPYLEKSDAPSILTITSISVKQPVANLMLSNVIRPAVIGLTKALAQEYGPVGIRANSILPGWTQTERVDYLLGYRAEQNDSTPEEEAAKIGGALPLRRIGQPEEFGRVAAFLVSPAASYVTGAMLQVDGGAYSGLM